MHLCVGWTDDHSHPHLSLFSEVFFFSLLCTRSPSWHIQLTLEQHRLELQGSTYTQISFNKYGAVSVSSLSYDFPKNISFSLVYFIVRIQYRTHIKCVLVNCFIGKASGQQ